MHSRKHLLFQEVFNYLLFYLAYPQIPFCEIRKKIGAGLDSTKMHVIRDYLLIQLRLQVLHPEEFWGAEIDFIICCKKTFSSIAQCHSYSFSYCS
jgi:hypothetical protein